jgi:hypothetical protein
VTWGQRIIAVIVGIIVLIFVLADPPAAGRDVHGLIAAIIGFAHGVSGK